MKDNKKNVSFQNEELQNKVKELIQKAQKLNLIKPLFEAFKKNSVKNLFKYSFYLSIENFCHFYHFFSINNHA